MSAKLAIVPTPNPKREPDIAFRHNDRIEPGEYPAYCRSTQLFFDDHFRRWILAVQFDVLDDALLSTVARLTKFFNLGERERPHATSRRSHFRKAWVLANDGRPPVRGQKMAPSIFVNRIARVRVVDVMKDHQGCALSSDEVYSRISEILRWETGRGINQSRPGTNNQLPSRHG